MSYFKVDGTKHFFIITSPNKYTFMLYSKWADKVVTSVFCYSHFHWIGQMHYLTNTESVNCKFIMFIAQVAMVNKLVHFYDINLCQVFNSRFGCIVCMR
jgi:hypothetical protein